MKGSQLTVYADSRRRLAKHLSVVQWVLDAAAKAGMQGATARGESP